MRSADLSLSVFFRTSISAWKTSILQRFLWKPSWTTMLCKRSRWSYTCRYSNDLWKHPARLCFFCKNQSEVCFLQDTFNGSASNKPFFTSVATITVRVKDVDNRPPWFQPCTRTNLGTAKLCVSSGYRGKVNLTEKQVGSDSGVYITARKKCASPEQEVAHTADISGPYFNYARAIVLF